jgi:preprotein translocase subunit SecG
MLVLLQLPKKEAGAGMAFGGAATDALFGAGSGNVLTKITKYVAGFFFGIALLMAVVAPNRGKTGAALLLQEITKRPPAPLSQGAPPPTAPVTTPTGNGLLDLSNSALPAVPPPQTQTPPPASATNK